jgi:hypothetical protein
MSFFIVSSEKSASSKRKGASSVLSMRVISSIIAPLYQANIRNDND